MGLFDLKYIGILILSVIGYMGYNIYTVLDFSRENHLLNASKCRIIKGIIGGEDVIKFGKFLITGSDDRMKMWELPNFTADQVTNGGLFLIEPESEKIRKLELADFPKDVAFHPHGMYFTKNQLLYVINHAYTKGGERVEVFGLNEGTESNFETLAINYKYSIKFDDIHNGRINDLVVTETGENKDEFYITSYLPFADPIEGRSRSVISKIKNFGALGLGLKLSYVYYCKGVYVKNVAHCQQIKSEKVNAYINNGITYNRKTNLIYIARTLNKSVGVFKIDENNASNLIHINEITLHNNPDNVEYDEENNSITIGMLTLTGQLNYVEKTIKGEFSFDHNDICWGGAEKINVDTNESQQVVTVNNKYCGFSSAYQYKNKMFMGSWAFDGLLVCDV